MSFIRRHSCIIVTSLLMMFVTAGFIYLLLHPVPRGSVMSPVRGEGCMHCHGKMRGLDGPHAARNMGCFVCHRGNPATLNSDSAHRGMLRNPGNLSDALFTCGASGCHTAVVYRVKNSLMARLGGMISVDRYIFGERDSPDDTASVAALGRGAADTHLRNLCAGCHLGLDKFVAGPPHWLERGGGCNACHLHYRPEAVESLKKSRLSPKALPSFHPSIDIQAGGERCMSCHSRSGRISLSYEGWTEIMLDPGEVKTVNGYRVLGDGRVMQYIGADIHHEKGLSCIDCHGSYELMGDGRILKHKEEAVNIRCSDCHFTGRPKWVSSASLEAESRNILKSRNQGKVWEKLLLTGRGSQPLLNTRIDRDGVVWLEAKLSGSVMMLKPPAKKCTGNKAHGRLSCESCHTAWVPYCLGCHTSYENNTMGWDMLTRQQEKGTWVEYAGNIRVDFPTLGIRGEEVICLMPGMILSIDKSSFPGAQGQVWQRLYASAPGHTTRQKGRSCRSCHNNPLALGYGRGELKYTIVNGRGRWGFEPEYDGNPHDGLPEDAWIPFLNERTGIVSTRNDIRPFSLAEQKRILTAGACLTCHDEQSAVMTDCLHDFKNTASRCTNSCVLPEFTH